MKNIRDGINRLDFIEEKIIEFKGLTIGTPWNEKLRKNWNIPTDNEWAVRKLFVALTQKYLKSEWSTGNEERHEEIITRI